MKTAICSALASIVLLASAGAASAGERVELSDAQMDGLTASGTAEAVAAAATLGDLLSETMAVSETSVNDGVLAVGQAQSAGLATSVVFGAASATRSTAAAALP